MSQLSFYVLIGANILLPIIIAFYLYFTRRFRKESETLASVGILIAWAVRFAINGYVSIVETGLDFVFRFQAFIMIGLVTFGFLWIQAVFPIITKSLAGKGIYSIHTISIIALLVLGAPLSILLPYDSNIKDINFTVSMILLLFAVILVVELVLRILVQFRVFQTRFQIYKWYNLGLVFGTVLILSSDTFFTWVIYDSELKLITPIVGFLIIFTLMIAVRAFPFFQFASTVDSGIIIVSEADLKIEFLNNTARAYISSENLNDIPDIQFLDLWPNSQGISNAFNRTLIEMRINQIEEQLYNFTTKQVQNVQLSFYPIRGEQTQNRIGVINLSSES